MPLILLLPALSCVQFPPVMYQVERSAPIEAPPATINVAAPETIPVAEPEPGIPLEIVIVPEQIPEPPTPVQRVQPVFDEPPIQRRPSQETHTETISGHTNSLERPEIPPTPERPVIPPIPEYILGQGLITEEILGAFLLQYNPDLVDFALEMAIYYVEEAAEEGINHDIAFAQMCLETGFLRFGNLVTPEMNNFSGLGSTGPGVPGLSFPDPRTGVRAHIQHLKAYATDEPPNLPLVNPRYFLVNFGSSPKISGLAGTWAEDRYYAVKINNILERLYEFSFLRRHIALE